VALSSLSHYYLLDKVADSRFAWVKNGLFDQNGEAMDFLAEDLEWASATVGSRGSLPDCLFVVGPVGRVISDRAAKVFRAEARCCEQFQWVPVRLLRGRAKTRVGDYWLLHQGKEYVVLDYALSDLVFMEGTDVIRRVDRWVLDGRILPALDLFRDDGTAWIATEAVKQLVETHELTGFQFTAVEVSYEGRILAQDN